MEKGEDAIMSCGASPARLDELDVRGGMRVAGPWKVRVGPFSDGSLWWDDRLRGFGGPESSFS